MEVCRYCSLMGGDWTSHSDDTCPRKRNVKLQANAYVESSSEADDGASGICESTGFNTTVQLEIPESSSMEPLRKPKKRSSSLFTCFTFTGRSKTRSCSEMYSRAASEPRASVEPNVDEEAAAEGGCEPQGHSPHLRTLRPLMSATQFPKRGNTAAPAEDRVISRSLKQQEALRGFCYRTSYAVAGRQGQPGPLSTENLEQTLEETKECLRKSHEFLSSKCCIPKLKAKYTERRSKIEVVDTLRREPPVADAVEQVAPGDREQKIVSGATRKDDIGSKFPSSDSLGVTGINVFTDLAYILTLAVEFLELEARRKLSPPMKTCPDLVPAGRNTDDPTAFADSTEIKIGDVQMDLDTAYSLREELNQMKVKIVNAFGIDVPELELNLDYSNVSPSTAFSLAYNSRKAHACRPRLNPPLHGDYISPDSSCEIISSRCPYDPPPSGCGHRSQVERATAAARRRPSYFREFDFDMLGHEEMVPVALARNPKYTNCYINAGMQMLCAVPDVYYFVREGCSFWQGSENRSLVACSAYKTFSEEITRVLNIEVRYRTVSNSDIMGDLMFKLRPNDFRRDTQGDCHEFVMSLLQILDEELGEEHSPLTRLFKGYQTRYLTRAAESGGAGALYTSPPTREEFTDLVISFNAEQETIEDCFDLYTRKELSDGGTVHQVLLAELPPLLLVKIQSIKTSRRGVKKSFRKLSLRETLVMRKEWMDESCEAEDCPECLEEAAARGCDVPKRVTHSLPRYRLKAVAFHAGFEITSGHYIAAVALPGVYEVPTWFSCNNELVKKIPQPEVQYLDEDAEVALLLYKCEKFDLHMI